MAPVILRLRSLWLLAFLIAGCQPTDPPIVRSQNVDFVGSYAGDGIARFAGVPFAAPPVGDARWERPAPFVAETAVIDATQFAPACMQSGSGIAWYHGMMARVGVDPSLMKAPAYSEDCLYLNIWTDLNTDEDKPVLVFIHGGSNTGGWSYEPNYWGESLAQRGVVVVTVAYRLGVFGWLSHPDMSIQNPGLHDLSAALNWVNDNIDDFGGDPTRMTVSGESAGADNALHLAISPAMEGVISGVIHQSAGWSATNTLSREIGFALGQALVSEQFGSKGEFTDLKKLSAEALLESQLSLFSDHYFSPIPDKETLPVSLEERVRSDTIPPLRLLIGSNLNEALMYLPEGATLEPYLEAGFPESEWSTIVDVLGRNLDAMAQADRLNSVMQYTCPSLMIASAVQNAGGSAWVYRFDRIRPGFESIGAYHGAELPYVFDTHDDWLPTETADRLITEALVDHWTSFVRNDPPDASLGAAWPRWGGTQKALLVGDVLSSDRHPDAELCVALEAAHNRG